MNFIVKILLTYQTMTVMQKLGDIICKYDFVFKTLFKILENS